MRCMGLKPGFLLFAELCAYDNYTVLTEVTRLAPAKFKGLVPRSASLHRDDLAIIIAFFKDAFTIRTLLLLGAVIQIFLSATLPPRVALLPAGLLTLYAVLVTATQSVRSPRDYYMRNVIPGRTSAQLPDRDTASFSNKPAAQPIVVFHFGVRFNHPLGLLCSGGLATIKHFTDCNKSIIAKADEYGMLGVSPWRAAERDSNNTSMMVYYFRDLEGLNKFAHDEMHRKAWDWIVKTGPKHIGFFHEAFCVPQEAYETIYVNFQPLLMGQTNVKCTDEEGEDVWVRPVVSADVSLLRSQFGRMGRAYEKFEA